MAGLFAAAILCYGGNHQHSFQRRQILSSKRGSKGRDSRDRSQPRADWLASVLGDAYVEARPVEVECTAFKVSYNGMEVKVAVNVAAPETSQLAHLGSRAEAFMLLMALEADMLADRQPKGDQQ